MAQIDRITKAFNELPKEQRALFKAENRVNMNVWRNYLPAIVDKIAAGNTVLLVNPSPPLITLILRLGH